MFEIIRQRQVPIGYLMINGIWRRSLLDINVRRGADVGSDHYLVMAFVKLKLKSTGHKPSGDRRYEKEKLQDPIVRTTFIIQLRNRFQALADMADYCAPESDPVNSIWKKCRPHIQRAAIPVWVSKR